MLPQENPHGASPREGIGLRSALGRDWRAMLAATAATVAIELAVFFLVRAHASELYAALSSLAAGAVWIALACPVLAAGGSNRLSSLLRGGIVADASAVAVVVIWLLSPYVAFVAAVKIYCIYAASALLGVAAVCCARTTFGRYVAATAATAALMLALATPFWIGGILKAADARPAGEIANAAVSINPFYSITAAVYEETKFSWDEARVMYSQVQQIQDYKTASSRWYSAAVVHAALAALLAAVGLLRRPKRCPAAEDI